MKSNVWREKLRGMNLQLDSVPFKIVYEPDMERRFHNLGQIGYYDNLIYLEPDLHERDMLQTIIHEILEFISRNRELDLHHVTITNLETALMGIIMKNPDLFEILVEEARRDIFENVGEEEEETVPTTA